MLRARGLSFERHDVNARLEIEARGASDRVALESVHGELMTKKTALVTGAGGGLGHATVERLVAHGWKVFEADISKEMLRSSIHDPDVVPVVMDVTDNDSIEGAYDAIASQTDRLDAIVNFAGVLGVGSLTDIPEERLARILDINVMGTYRVNKKFLPLVEAAKGRIVNLSSETGWQSAAPFNGPYAMSKHAIEAYSTALRRELALLGIKVVTIQPGAFRTNMVAGIERAFTAAEAETPKFAPVLRKLKALAGKEIESARDPDILAQVIETALTAKHPRPVYSVKPDKLRSALEALPLRASDRLYLAVLQRARKG
jgi:NAD(P)-dependent dehydrogenase (short-subunit alcohol dehydrogenase family)